MLARLYRILAVAFLSLLVAACRATHPGEPTAPAISEASSATATAIAMPDAWGNPYAGQRRMVDGYTYTTDLVEGRLGPHRVRFPANFYYDQIGPDFQGGITLVLLWPELVPSAPGEDFADSEDLLARNIRIYPDYVDRVPVAGFLDRKLVPTDEYQRSRPTESLDVRIKGDPVHGLAPYYTDFKKVDAWAQRVHGRHAKTAAERRSIFNNDWYVAQNRRDEVTTFITCTSREVPDGIRFINGRTVESRPPIAQCTHWFTIPARRLVVDMSYKRAMLRDWQEIEQRVRKLLEVAQVH